MTTALAVLVMVAILGMGTLARMSVASGGLSMADFLVRTQGRRSAQDQAHQVFRAERARMVGLTVLAAVATVAAWPLGGSARAIDHQLAVVVGLCLMARVYLLPPVLRAIWAAAGLAVAVHSVLDLPSAFRSIWIAALVLGVIAAAVLGVPAARGWSRPRRPARQMVAWAEICALLALVCAGAIAVGVPTVVRHLLG
jgi:hypothetical protein